MKTLRMLGLLLATWLFSYNSHAQEPCGSDFIHAKAFEDADYSRSFFRLQEIFDTKRKTLVNSPKVIPTIVHILHSGEPYGQFPHVASDEVYVIMDTLNTWYESVGSNIEFCLASIGPNGEAINPVQYHDVNVVYNGDASGSPYDYNTAIMNATIIEPDEYLNIYVHDWSGSPSGFANVGNGDNCWVKTVNFFNPNSTTLIHETGHWCGLFHTFTKGPFQGNYSSCEEALGESNCEGQGDYVCDTPATPPDFSCNDACAEIDEVDESWMSYAPDNCQYLFTQGQIDRMHEQLEIYREDIITNNIACGTSDVDLAVIGFANQNSECDTYLDPVVTIKNYGNSGAWLVECTLEVLDSGGEVIYSDIYVGNVELEEDETIEIPFGDYTFQFGDYTAVIELYTPLDGWEYNNVLEQELPLQPFIGMTMELSMNNFPTVQWRLFNWDPETDNTNGVVHSCNWGGPECWENFVQDPSEYWPIELDYCLQPGCYDLFWRYTGNVNMTNCVLFTGQECYNTVYLSNGEVIFYDEGPQEGGNYHYYFCVEAPNPCPINDCPTDLDGDGIIGNSDLLIFLPEIGQQSECHPTDFNFDGETDINDLTLFLNQYGYGCDGEYYGIDGTVEGDIMSIDYILNLNDAKIIQSEIYDLSGRIMNTKGTLPEGIYIVKQYWDKYGFVTTKKLYISQ